MSIDELFEELDIIYAGYFSRAFELNAAKAKQIWAKHLSKCSAEGIAYALEHLPGRPPSAVEFVQICQQRPRYNENQLTYERKNTPIPAHLREKFKPKSNHTGSVRPIWVRRNMERFESLCRYVQKATINEGYQHGLLTPEEIEKYGHLIKKDKQTA